MYKKLERNTSNILEEIVKRDGLINIDLNQFNTSKPGELVGTIRVAINNPADMIVVNKKCELAPTELLIKIIAKSDLTISELDQIINNIKSLYNDIEIIFAMSIDDNQDSLCRILGMLIHR